MVMRKLQRRFRRWRRVSHLIHTQVLLDEQEAHLLGHASKGEAPTDMAPTVVLRTAQQLYRKILRFGRKTAEFDVEAINTMTEMLQYAVMQAAPLAKMGTVGLGAVAGLGNPEEGDMVCPNCANPITGVYEPGDYTCSGCSAQVRVNPEEKKHRKAAVDASKKAKRKWWEGKNREFLRQHPEWRKRRWNPSKLAEKVHAFNAEVTARYGVAGNPQVATRFAADVADTGADHHWWDESALSATDIAQADYPYDLKNSSINKLMKKKGNRVAIFTMGMPAAGKSTVVCARYDEKYPGTTPDMPLILDPDRISVTLPGYDPDEPGGVHGEANRLIQLEYKKALDAGDKHIVMDTTGTDFKKLKGRILEAKDAGYKIGILLVIVELETSIKRNQQRDRKVSEDIIKTKFEQVSETFNRVDDARLADAIDVVSTENAPVPPHLKWCDERLANPSPRRRRGSGTTAEIESAQALRRSRRDLAGQQVHSKKDLAQLELRQLELQLKGNLGQHDNGHNPVKNPSSHQELFDSIREGDRVTIRRQSEFTRGPRWKILTTTAVMKRETMEVTYNTSEDIPNWVLKIGNKKDYIADSDTVYVTAAHDPRFPSEVTIVKVAKGRIPKGSNKSWLIQRGFLPQEKATDNPTNGYTAEEIAVANKTGKGCGSGSVGRGAITPKWVIENAKKGASVLDYGAGVKAANAEPMREAGFKVAAHEFGSNAVAGVHDPKALSRKYDVVVASNVLNVQSSAKMLDKTLGQIRNALKKNGYAVFNFPKSPRKGVQNASEAKALVEKHFASVEQLNKDSSAPLWKASGVMQNPIRTASKRNELSMIDRRAVSSGDVLVYKKANYIVDDVMTPEDYVALGLNDVAEVMRRQKIIKELVVFKPSKQQYPTSRARGERRWSLRLYASGKLSDPQSKTVGMMPAGQVR